MSGPESEPSPEAASALDARRLLDVVRQVSADLGGTGLEVGLDSDLERHLGLGSLERVELLTRLESAFGVVLPDSALSEARTPRHLLASLAAGSGRPLLQAAPAAAPARASGCAPLPPEGAVRSVLDVLRYRAERDGDRPVLHILDDQLGPSSFSARDLWRKALATSAGLSARGIRHGDRVALILPTGQDFFVAFMGILGAGAVPVPIYPPLRLDQLPPYLLRHAPILANAGVRAIVTDVQLRPVAGLLRDRVPCVENILTVETEPADEGFAGAAPTGDDLGLIQYTSGSTGEPKGVALRHRNLLANMRACSKGLGLGPEDVCVSWLPLYHDMGLIGAWLATLLHGMPLVLLSPLQFLSRPERWLWAIHRFRGTISASPNFGYELCCRRIADAAIEGLDLSSWKMALNGSEPVLPDTIDRFCARFGPYGFRRGTMLPVYGMAENCVGLSFPPPGREPRVDEIDRERLSTEGRAVPGSEAGGAVLRLASVGRALEGSEIRLVPAEDPHGAELPERREGRILFRGASAMAGYFGRPEATEAVMVDGWIDSGDLGYLADGELYVTGRVKDLVIKGGRKYHPQDIEGAAASVEGVRRGCVVAFAAPDPQRGEAIVVVAETHMRASELQELAGKVSAAVLDAAGTPADQVLLVPPGTIPKTSSGKLRRRETRQRYLEGRLHIRRRPWLGLAGIVVASARARLRTAARGALRLGYGLLATGIGAAVLSLTVLRLALCRDREAAWQAARRWLVFFFAASALPLRREGAPLATGPAVLVANHGSYLDPLCLIPYLERPVAILAVDWAFRLPLLGRCLERLGCVSVVRAAGRGSMESLERAREALRQGRQVLIFPEGTFGPAEGVRPFRLGAFQLAAEEGVPVQPIGIRGARQAFRDGARLLRHSPVTVDVLPPVPPASPDRLREVSAQREAVRQALARACGEPLLQIATAAPVPAAPPA